MKGVFNYKHDINKCNQHIKNGQISTLLSAASFIIHKDLAFSMQTNKGDKLVYMKGVVNYKHDNNNQHILTIIKKTVWDQIEYRQKIVFLIFPIFCAMTFNIIHCFYLRKHT